MTKFQTFLPILTFFYHQIFGFGYQNPVRLVGYNSNAISIRNTVLEMSTGSAAAALVKKSKMKDILELKKEVDEAGADHLINKYLTDGTRAFGVGNPIGFVNATSNRFETLAVIPEFNRKTKTGFIMGLPPPEILGGVLRDAGSRGVVVSLDKRSGGASVKEFERFTREQTRARIMMPGPIPIIWNDFIIDDIQIILAGANGAAAVTLYPEYSPDLNSHVNLCKAHNIEPIIMVRNVEDGLKGIAAGAKCFCLHTLEESELVEVRKNLPDNPEYLYGARLRPETEFSLYAEIDTTWVLRDNKFNFVWPSPDSIYATGMTDIYPAVLAMRAKASRVFLSPRQFLMDRRKEGAQEYLGDILY